MQTAASNHRHGQVQIWCSQRLHSTLKVLQVEKDMQFIVLIKEDLFKDYKDKGCLIIFIIAQYVYRNRGNWASSKHARIFNKSFNNNSRSPVKRGTVTSTAE